MAPTIGVICTADPSSCLTNFNGEQLIHLYGREGAAKIFQMPLQAAQIAKNQMAGTPIMSALTTRSAPRDKATEEVERQMAAHVASHGRKRRRVGGALDGSFAGGQDQAEEVNSFCAPQL